MLLVDQVRPNYDEAKEEMMINDKRFYLKKARYHDLETVYPG